ncbi:phosphate acyltransferase PlsX [bacterium]|nr:phosphate acyltransferase PlsX [bacterium]
MADKICIIVDASSGDSPCEVVTKGAIDALYSVGGFDILLTGEKERIGETLSKLDYPKERVNLLPADAGFPMAEKTTSIKKLLYSSIGRGLEVLREGKGDGFCSMGNTAAVVSGAVATLGRLPGVVRPALLTHLPSKEGDIVFLDAGATVDAQPEVLAQFALMGSGYAKEILNIENPKVALLSIGEEETKGNTASKAAYQIISRIQGINFIGNIEGTHILTGKADVIVCDGFVGNILLKFTESIFEVISSFYKKEDTDRCNLEEIKSRFDYSEQGGALLLGVNGVVVVGHGRSNAKAVKNAVLLTLKMVRHRILRRIGEIRWYART